MYTILIKSHWIIVTLFLLHYVTKLLLLLLNRKENLAAYSRVTKIPEMLLSVGFLVTGGWMMFSGALFNKLLVIKLVCVFASIPLAVVGFRKGNKALAVVSVFLIIAAYGLAEMNKKGKTGGKMDTSEFAGNPIAEGQFIFAKSCVNCHGADGKMGGSGAMDLSASVLSAEEAQAVIRKGRNAMPGYKDLTDEQVSSVAQYIQQFKSN